jgi:hypothetical protein
MTRIVRLLLVFLALGIDGGSRSGQLQAQVSTEDLVQRSSPAVVQILVQRPSGHSQGSGFIVDPNGTILTNYHVIEGAVEAAVRLPSGEVFGQVEVLAEDARRDIAVIRIAGFDLPATVLGNSDSLRIGATVVAIGSPLGLENSVSTGVLSGRRQQEGFSLLQITAPVSPGSSGGPLFNEAGLVVGITVSQLRDGQNLNFAVPINYARGLLARTDSRESKLLAPLSSPTTQAGRTGAGNAHIPSVDFDKLASYTAEYRIQFENNVTGLATYTLRLDRSSELGEVLLERTQRREVWTKSAWGGRGDKITDIQFRAEAVGPQLSPRAFFMQARWWDGQRWQAGEAQLRGADGRVYGRSSTQQYGSHTIDAKLPTGVTLAQFAAPAFRASPSFGDIGSTFTISTYDPVSGQMEQTHYRSRRFTTLGAAGRQWEALEVEISGGASIATAYYSVEVPRFLLAYEGPTERLELFSYRID